MTTIGDQYRLRRSTMECAQNEWKTLKRLRLWFFIALSGNPCNSLINILLTTTNQKARCSNHLGRTT
jgi:hypothetical protein